MRLLTNRILFTANVEIKPRYELLAEFSGHPSIHGLANLRRLKIQVLRRFKWVKPWGLKVESAGFDVGGESEVVKVAEAAGDALVCLALLALRATCGRLSRRSFGSSVKMRRTLLQPLPRCAAIT